MSHKTVYMGIPAVKFNGKFDENKIESIVEKTMEKYLEETAKEDNIKCDWYVIGGRWAGAFGAVKGAKNVILSENGEFAYKMFDEYNLIVNKGARGPYFVGDTEYVPISGGLKKEIAWNVLYKFDAYKMYKFLELAIKKDPFLGGEIPEGLVIRDEGLYNGNDDSANLLLKHNETFDEWNERLERHFDRAIMPPDAYIDTKGVWHDDNDVWEVWQNNMLSGKFETLPEDPNEAAQEMLMESFNKFLDEELKDYDFFVVLDCHCFP